MNNIKANGSTKGNLEQAFQIALRAYQTGDINAAISHCQKILLKDNNNFSANDLLGALCGMIGQNKLAVKYLKKTLEIKPDHVEALNNLGLILCYLGLLEESEEKLKKAVLLAPNFSEAHNNLGFTLSALKKMEEAKLVLHKSIKLKPDYAEPYNNLGVVYRYLREKELSISFFKKCIKLQPDYCKAYYNLSCVSDYELTETENTTLVELLSTIKNPEDRVNCYFALYKSSVKKASYSKAFEYLDAGNSAKFTQIKQSSEKGIDLRKVEQGFDAKFFENRIKLSSLSITPVFIVGMPRSGSSLLEQMLTSHPEVCGLGESQTMQRALLKVSRLMASDVNDLFEKIIKADEVSLKNIVAQYCQSFKKELGEHLVYTDKMLDNYKYIGFIKMLIPNARFVHIKRNPLDTCLSCYEQNFTRGHAYTFNLNSLAEHFIAYQSLMQHWQTIFPQDIYEISYESLVANTETEIQQCLNFIGLKMDAACLEFYNNNRSVITASTDQVQEKITSKSIGKWKLYEEGLKPLLKRLRDKGITFGE